MGNHVQKWLKFPMVFPNLMLKMTETGNRYPVTLRSIFLPIHTFAVSPWIPTLPATVTAIPAIDSRCRYLLLYLFVYLKQQKRVIDSKNGSNYLLLYLLNKRKHI